jgi:DNA-binding NtrC family response regulator
VSRPTHGRILVSTHDLPRAGELRSAFEDEGYEVELVTAGEALTPSEEPRILVLSDGATREVSADLRRQARELHLPVLGYATSQVEGPSAPPAPEGVLEVFPPEMEAREVALVGRRLLDRRKLQEVTGIVGETDAMREVMERVVQIAPVDSTVLVTGESGTGKELVARGVHALSHRRHSPFIAVNVAALADTLLESELFGHEKGAFTGAVDSRKGIFELGDEGTVFLDEIGEMPLATQTKLLRVLEQREFQRVGGETTRRVDVRIIAATNRDLRLQVNQRDFRQDLYYRLNVLRIELPPLRARPRDIPLLVDAFVRELEERHDRSFPGIAPEAMEVLMDHRWPGNVRELRNLVESMVVLAPDRPIQPGDIPPEVRGEAGPGRALVPGSVPRAILRTADEAGLPHRQLESFFQMLMDLRMDLEDVRREFERFRREQADTLRAASRSRGLAYDEEGPVRIVEVTPRIAEERGETATSRRGEGQEGVGEPAGGEAAPGIAAEGTPSSAEPGIAPDEDGAEEEGVVVFRPGMTMEDMEREAIAAALEEVDGNRRQAAQMLGIGERTLYRKLRKYDLGDD